MSLPSLWIRYEIDGRTYDAGPYETDEIFIQRRDIEGFEGVENTRIVNDEERTPNGVLPREGVRMKLETKWMSNRFEGTIAAEREVELRKMAALERIAASLEDIRIAILAGKVEPR